MGEYFTRTLARYMHAMRTKMNRQLLADLELANCVGVNINNIVSAVPSSSCKEVTMLNIDGQNLQDGFNTMRIDFDDNQMNGMPAIIGQGNFERFLMNSDVGCCNDGGIDMAQVAEFIGRTGLSFWKDQNFNEIIGEDNIWMIAPGAMQVLTFNENQGPGNVGWNENYAHMRIPDDKIPGLVYDFDIIYDSCKKIYKERLSVWFDHDCWPSDVFAAGDELEGVTGIFCFNINRAS